MIVPRNMSKQAWLVPCAVCISIFLPLSALGQDPRGQPGEIKAVVRISKLMIEDVVSRKEIVANIPYTAKVVGFRCRGVIDGRGKLSVEMTADQGQGAFIVSGKGTGQADVRGVLGPIVAMGRAWGPFASRTSVRFDGRKFSLVETCPWSEVHGELEFVEGRHGGPVGRAGGHLLLPLGRLLVPRAEREAVPIANYYLTNFVNELAEDIVGRLNRTTPVEQSIHRLFPETRDWGFQMSTDSQFIQAAYGPRGIAAPILPENPGRFKDTRLELWLRTSTTEAQALEKLTKQPLAKQLVQRYIEATLPELAALTEERTVTAVGQWLVICVGAPKAD